VRERLERLWAHVFFRPAHPLGLVAARTIVCAQALWILLSRPDLPELVAWPDEFAALGGRALALRFGVMGLPLAVERGLFLLLHGVLLSALVGLRPRVSCLLAGLLLYHFAPFEELIAGLPHTAFGGLTVPTLALLLLSFAEPPSRRAAPAADYRWPLALIQLLFSFSYLFPTLAKLRFSGPGWFSAETIHYYALGNATVTGAPLAVWVASQPLLCEAIALGTFLVEVSAPLVVVFPAFAAAFVPAALAFHLGIVLVIGYFFPSLPLLLLLLDWDALGRRLAPMRET
jgi:hypothetical protein